MHTVENKYSKIKTCNYHGHIFESRKEGGHFRNFEKLKEKGLIKDFHKQTLIEFYIKSIVQVDGRGDRHQSNPIILARVRLRDVYLNEVQPDLMTKKLVNYKCDFLVEHNGGVLNDGVKEFVEVKGRISQDWKRCWDLLEACFGLNEDYKLSIIK